MKKVNIIIPAFNEAYRLPNTLKNYIEYFSKQERFGISTNVSKYFNLNLIIVSDGSTDETVSYSKSFIADNNLVGQVIVLNHNQGKGAAIRKGVLSDDTADYYYLADADMSASWSVLKDFLNIIKSQNADVVIASRAVKNFKVDTLWYKKLFGRGASFMINTLLKLDIKDTQCGYKLFNKSYYQAFGVYQINHWGFDFELLYILKKQDKKIIEQGIDWKHIPASNVSFGAYLQTVVDLIRVRFG